MNIFVNTNDFSGLVDLNKVLFYTAHREKYISKGRGPDFVNAVKSLEEFMSDRTVRKNSTKRISVSFNLHGHGIIHFITFVISEVPIKCTANGNSSKTRTRH